MSRRYFFTLLIIFIGIVSLWQFNTLSVFFSERGLSVAAPFWRAENYITQKMREYSTLAKNKESLFRDNKLLEEEIKKTELSILSNKFLLQENKELKEILGRQVDGKRMLLTAVLAKPNRSPYDTLVLDGGSHKGISTGDSVVAYGDILIGRISKVSGKSAQAILFSSPGEETGVIIGKEHIAARARGIGGGNFEIMLPRGVDINEGDIVSFSALNMEILGVVEKIKVKPVDSFQTILFKSPINIYELRFVEIIIE